MPREESTSVETKPHADTPLSGTTSSLASSSEFDKASKSVSSSSLTEQSEPTPGDIERARAVAQENESEAFSIACKAALRIIYENDPNNNEFLEMPLPMGVYGWLSQTFEMSKGYTLSSAIEKSGLGPTQYVNDSEEGLALKNFVFSQVKQDSRAINKAVFLYHGKVLQSSDEYLDHSMTFHALRNEAALKGRPNLSSDAIFAKRIFEDAYNVQAMLVASENGHDAAATKGLATPRFEWLHREFHNRFGDEIAAQKNVHDGIDLNGFIHEQISTEYREVKQAYQEHPNVLSGQVAEPFNFDIYVEYATLFHEADEKRRLTQPQSESMSILAFVNQRLSAVTSRELSDNATAIQDDLQKPSLQADIQPLRESLKEKQNAVAEPRRVLHEPQTEPQASNRSLARFLYRQVKRLDNFLRRFRWWSKMRRSKNAGEMSKAVTEIAPDAGHSDRGASKEALSLSRNVSEEKVITPVTPVIHDPISEREITRIDPRSQRLPPARKPSVDQETRLRHAREALTQAEVFISGGAWAERSVANHGLKWDLQAGKKMDAAYAILQPDDLEILKAQWRDRKNKALIVAYEQKHAASNASEAAQLEKKINALLSIDPFGAWPGPDKATSRKKWQGLGIRIENMRKLEAQLGITEYVNGPSVTRFWANPLSNDERQTLQQRREQYQHLATYRATLSDIMTWQTTLGTIALQIKDLEKNILSAEKKTANSSSDIEKLEQSVNAISKTLRELAPAHRDQNGPALEDKEELDRVQVDKMNLAVTLRLELGDLEEKKKQLASLKAESSQLESSMLEKLYARLEETADKLDSQSKGELQDEWNKAVDEKIRLVFLREKSSNLETRPDAEAVTDALVLMAKNSASKIPPQLTDIGQLSAIKSATSKESTSLKWAIHDDIEDIKVDVMARQMQPTEIELTESNSKILNDCRVKPTPNCVKIAGVEESHTFHNPRAIGIARQEAHSGDLLILVERDRSLDKHAESTNTAPDALAVYQSTLVQMGVMTPQEVERLTNGNPINLTTTGGNGFTIKKGCNRPDLGGSRREKLLAAARFEGMKRR